MQHSELDKAIVNKQRSAVYAGTFDPVTLGHIWMIEQGANLFDKLIVAMGENVGKTHLFSLEERISLLKKATAEFKNVIIREYSNKFLIRYVEEVGAKFILRGIRNSNDYEIEKVMRNVHSDLNPDITEVFLMPPREIAEISSSIVKGFIGPDGWEEVVCKYVPECVMEKLRERKT